MKRKIITGSIVTLFIGIFLYFSFGEVLNDEIKNAPDWVPLEEALETAQLEENEKLILIDIYEVGCRFCRQMEREVYPSESIRTLIDRDFIPVRVNGNSERPIVYLGESMSQKEFADKMGLTAFPFTVVMDSNGNVLNSRRGYMGVVELSRFLNDILRDVRQT